MHDDWLTYEQAARSVVAHLRRALGVNQVNGKQSIAGLSGANWEFDAVARHENDARLLLIEARRYTTSRLKQEHLAAFAFRIQDVGAAGGIIATPLPLQEGAAKVAASANILHLQLSADSTPEVYLAQYMGQSYRGFTVEESLSTGLSIPLSGELR